VLRQALKDLGGQVATAFNTKVTDVVSGEKAGSKLKKAQESGIAILDENTFLQLIGQHREQSAV
jgi:DNA ligase (NAD+)